MEKKCPLCGKLNPLTEWVCEDCGAELPLKGHRAVPIAEIVKGPQQPQAKTQKQEFWQNGCFWAMMVFFVVFVFLPWACESISNGLAPVPTPYPTAVLLPTSPPAVPVVPGQVQGESTEVWVNTRSGIYHYRGSRWYGNTKSGRYMSEAEARASGYRSAQNGQ